MSIKAKQRYLKSNNRLKINQLKADADIMPARHRNFRDFKASFGNVNHYNTEIFGYRLHVDIRYAFKHFTINTHNEHRHAINATLFPTINNPILVVKDTYKGTPNLTFYKAFKEVYEEKEDELIHVFMYKACLDETTGVYKFKTVYEASNLSKVKNIINKSDLDTVYFKYTQSGSGS